MCHCAQALHRHDALQHHEGHIGVTATTPGVLAAAAVAQVAQGLAAAELKIHPGGLTGKPGGILGVEKMDLSRFFVEKSCG